MKKLGILLGLCVALYACSGSEKKEEAQEEAVATAPETTTDEATATAQDGIEKVNLYSNDQMKFDKNEIKVKAGSKVELTLTHTGAMKKETMGHNFVLLKPGTDLIKFTGEASKAADNEYIPKSDAVIAHTKLIGGGESTTVTFDAPAAGTYDFICSFPGHYALMKGKFIVE